MYETMLARATHRREINDRLTRLIVEGIDLPIAPEDIDDDQPLFGRGLELDSLDTLEIVSLVEEEFGVAITDDDKFVFGSINSLADRIEREAAE